jgi:ectoine hydroxylase-related dioxygenase (phytanoyl-CoA dioxygenase family)
VSLPVPKGNAFVFGSLPNMLEGSMIILHGGLLHKSYSNLSESSRQAFTFHVVDARSCWSPDNW